MSVTATSSSTSSTSNVITSATSSSGLGEDAFLKLLVTQMQNQDPLNPMSSTDYIAQLAQFSSVEQLTTANTQLAALQVAQATSQSLALIGHTIVTADGATTGVVDSVQFVDGMPQLVVGGELVDPGDVSEVTS
jgi:flagellar basal-body rod modification protein FlgD